MYEFGEGHCYKHPNVNRVRFPSTQHPVFDHIQKHSKILDCVEDLVNAHYFASYFFDTYLPESIGNGPNDLSTLRELIFAILVY